MRPSKKIPVRLIRRQTPSVRGMTDRYVLCCKKTGAKVAIKIIETNEMQPHSREDFLWSLPQPIYVLACALLTASAASYEWMDSATLVLAANPVDSYWRAIHAEAAGLATRQA
jgi:hypothetical protein